MRTDRNGQLLLIVGGLLVFTMIGWTSLLMPSLIRDIQRDLVVNDADMGGAYLLFTAAFLGGCLFTGAFVSRLGRRPVLLTGVGLLIAGSTAALVPSWPVFLGAAALRGFGSGIIEVGIQGLFLVAFTGSIQGRAINSVHFCYSLGAALAPITIAAILGLGVAWQPAMAMAVVPWVVAGVLLAIAPMDARQPVAGGAKVRFPIGFPLVAAAIGIALYVACEAGVSSWLVRFLADADLSVAATALTLFWGSLAVSRLIVARFGHHVAPERLSIAGFIVAAVALAGAVLVPAVGVSIALFALAGFAFGPVYAGIILLGGRIPGSKDAVTSILASAGVSGAVIYPPLMGVLSLGPGLGVAMLGTALLSVAGAAFTILSVRALRSTTAPEPVATAA